RHGSNPTTSEYKRLRVMAETATTSAIQVPFWLRKRPIAPLRNLGINAVTMIATSITWPIIVAMLAIFEMIITGVIFIQRFLLEWWYRLMKNHFLWSWVFDSRCSQFFGQVLQVR